MRRLSLLVITACFAMTSAYAADVKLEQVRPRLVEELRERKSREAAQAVFRQLQDASRVENVMNDPAKAAAMPVMIADGVARTATAPTPCWCWS